MATYLVFNTVLDLAGQPADLIPVAIDLIPGPAFRISDGTEIESRVETKTNEFGYWEYLVEETANINPTDSVYRVTEYIPWVRGGKRVWFFKQRVGGGKLYDQLVEPSIPVGLVIPGHVTSGTRPTNPDYGDMIIESDTGKVLIWYGPNTGWQPPWNVGWGEVARAQLSTDQTTSATAAADVPGFAITIPSVANRKYECRLNCQAGLATTVTTFELQITDAANAIIQRRQLSIAGSSVAWQIPVDMKYREAASLGTGDVIRKVRFFVGVGTAVGTIYASNGFNAELIARDIGPLGAPL